MLDPEYILFSNICDKEIPIIQHLAPWNGSQHDLYVFQASPNSGSSRNHLRTTWRYLIILIRLLRGQRLKRVPYAALRKTLECSTSPFFSRSSCKIASHASAFHQLTLSRSTTFTLIFFPHPPELTDCGVDPLQVHVLMHPVADQL